MNLPRSFRPAVLTLASVLAMAGAGARAGSISYAVTPIELTSGGVARSINDLGEVAVWVKVPGSIREWVPSVWTGAPVTGSNACCVIDFSLHPTALFIDNSGAVRGEFRNSSNAIAGVILDRSTGNTSEIGSGYLPTGRGSNGNWLAFASDVGSIMNGFTVTRLPLPAGATRAWGYAEASGVVVGKVDIGGLGYAARFAGGSASLLHSGPSIAFDVNEQGLWAGMVGSGDNTQAVLGGPAGLTVLQDPSPAYINKTAIAINNAGQVLAGSGGNTATSQPIVFEPFLYGNGRAMRLQDMVHNGWQLRSATDMNEHGQIVALADGAFVLLTPQGTLSWASTSGGHLLDSANWDSGLGFVPSKFLGARYDSVASQFAWLDRDAHVLSFSMGAGAGRTTLELRRGALLRSEGGWAIESNGVLTGDGRVQASTLENRGLIAAANLTVSSSGTWIDGNVSNQGLISGQWGDGATLRAGSVSNTVYWTASGLAPGRMRVDAGQSLRVEGGLYNAGQIEVFGGTFSHNGPTPMATVASDFGGGTLVQGRILARGATLRFESGAEFSGGQLAFSGGVSDVFGRVELVSPGLPNEPQGQVIVSGRAEVTFWDAVRNNGELRVSAGSTATFFGLVSGAGRFTGSGTKFMEGGFAPGNSPALVQVEGDLTMGASSALLMELGGTTPGTGHDKLAVGGALTLSGGPLQVVWWNGFSAGAGDRFDLLDWGALSGSFGAVSLPALADGLAWDLSGLYLTGEIAVATVPEPGRLSLALAGLLAVATVARRRSRG